MAEVKTYWVSGIVADNEPLYVYANTPCLSMKEALALVWKYHQNYGMLAAWIKDEDNKPVWVHSFINIVGGQESREKEPRWLEDGGEEKCQT